MDSVMAQGWLMRGDEVLMAAEIGVSRRSRRRGLTGRDRIDGAFVLPKCHHVHTFGMKVPIDAVLCSKDGAVLRIATLAPNRLGPFVIGCGMIVEMAEGAADRKQIRVGDRIEVRR
jgi:uncharacterized protein